MDPLLIVDKLDRNCDLWIFKYSVCGKLL